MGESGDSCGVVGRKLTMPMAMLGFHSNYFSLSTNKLTRPVTVREPRHES